MCAKRKISGGRTWTFLCIAILRVARARARAGGVPLTRRRRRRRSARVRARGWTNTLRDEEFSAAMCARDESGTVRSRVQSDVGSARSEDTEGTEKKVVFSVPSVLALSAPCWDECALGSKAVWREAGRRRGRARRAGLARALTAGLGVCLRPTCLCLCGRPSGSGRRCGVCGSARRRRAGSSSPRAPRG